MIAAVALDHAAVCCLPSSCSSQTILISPASHDARCCSSWGFSPRTASSRRSEACLPRSPPRAATRVMFPPPPFICRLFELATTAGTDTYHMYCRREKRCIVEVLEVRAGCCSRRARVPVAATHCTRCVAAPSQDFGSVHVPLGVLVQLLPRIQPRSYSIASAFDYTPGTLELCVAVVKYTTPFKRVILVRLLSCCLVARPASLLLPGRAGPVLQLAGLSETRGCGPPLVRNPSWLVLNYSVASLHGCSAVRCALVQAEARPDPLP